MSADGKKLDDVAKSLEEQYFARREHELLQAQRRKAADEEEMRRLGETLGVYDQDLLAGLREVGLSAAQAALVHILPGLEVAWADGRVGDPERVRLEQLLRDHSGGMAPSPEAAAQLAAWIAHPPAGRLFDHARKVAAVRVAGAKEPDRPGLRKRILGEAVSVAEAAGGVLGIAAVSSAERRVLDTLRAMLGG
jgi:hypothetical protein